MYLVCITSLSTPGLLHYSSMADYSVLQVMATNDGIVVVQGQMHQKDLLQPEKEVQYLIPPHPPTPLHNLYE